MYERSAIVLEKYFNSICGLDKKISLKTIYKDYKELLEDIKNYQNIVEEEDSVINDFDEVANNIRLIQQEQKKLHKINLKCEEERNRIFDNFDEEPLEIEKKLIKLEEILEKNNNRIVELRKEFLNAVIKFTEKQNERNTYSRNRRESEALHRQILERCQKNIEEIEIPELKKLKEFIKSETSEEENDVTEIMIGNGKDEKVPFDKNVIEKAAYVRNQIAKKEAECYVIIFERMKKLLIDISSEEIKLDKYTRALRDVSVKLEFLKAEKMYIVSFLDNERMTSMNGPKAHKQLMLDACEKFDSDIQQIDNLYDLILKEISGKATKKAYKELYDKEYLKNIEEKEKKFEKEVNNINIKAGTIINSNYWRTDEIKNIYEVFLKEVSEKFEKDLSEYKLEDVEEVEEVEIVLDEKENIKVEEDIVLEDVMQNDEQDDSYDDEYEFDYDEYDDDIPDEENDDEYDEDEYEDYDDEDEQDEEYDEYDEDEEFEDDEEDEYEDDDEYEEDEYEDDEEYEYDDEEDDDDMFDIQKEIKKEINKKDNMVTKNKKGIFNKLFKDKKD